MDKLETPILLSCPHMGDDELSYVKKAFDTNWVAPLGPNVKEFESLLCQATGSTNSVAMSSGTAALHIALTLLEVRREDTIFVSDLTFIGSTNPILYMGATPVLIDSEPDSWCISPQALSQAFKDAVKINKLPKALIVVDLFGNPANYAEILRLCQEYDVPIIEDAAESLGSLSRGVACGNIGFLNVLSFNGNKIITTGGGGALLCNDQRLAEKALFFITQARDPAPYYQHSEMGFNYRMSNVLAGIGCGQMNVLSQRVKKRRQIFDNYQEALTNHLPIFFQEELKDNMSNRWLTALAFNTTCNIDILQLIQALQKQNIESRPIFKPMHLQPLFANCKFFAHAPFGVFSSTSEYLFNKGLCLPSSTIYETDIYKCVIDIFKEIVSSEIRSS